MIRVYLQLRQRTMVVHCMTGRWERSLKGWMRTPSGSRAFFSSASVSGIRVRVERNISLLQFTEFHCSACSLGLGGTISPAQLYCIGHVVGFMFSDIQDRRSYVAL